MLFCFRLLFGITSEFWFEDELQIYLIGLKFYTTGNWPFFGPDVVYTQSQIPGAIQGLLTGLPFYLFPIPEAPYIFLNIISFLSLVLFACYVTKRIPSLPEWFVWIITLTTPWVLNFSTHIVNPSYVLPFSIIFFISFFESIPLYKDKIFNTKLSLFLMGLTVALIMQLHLSWILLVPFIIVSLFYSFKNKGKNKLVPLLFCLAGFLSGASLLIPTFIKYGISGTGGTESNLIFNPGNIKNFVTVLCRYFSLAAYEIPYMLGGNSQERMEVIKNYPWIAPSSLILLIVGWLQVCVFIFFLIKKNISREFHIVRIITAVSFFIVFISFFFSVKGPSSHTFYVIIPIPLLFSFYCYNYFVVNYKKWFNYISVTIITLSFIMYLGIISYNFNNKSLYKDRQKVENAINKKNYKLLSPRRADVWRKGY